MEASGQLRVIENCLTCKMRSEEFFCALPDSALALFQGIKSTTTYPPRTRLFAEGQPPHGVYMLCSGGVELSVRSRSGEEVGIRNSQPGEVLGLHACVSGVPYDVTAETTEESQINFVRREDFLRFIQENGEACLQAAQQLGQRCHSAYSLVRSFELSHSAAERLARLLLEVAVHAGSHGASGPRFNTSLTPDQIAGTIGASREVVANLLQEFSDKGLATLKGGVLEIQNRTELERLVAS